MADSNQLRTIGAATIKKYSISQKTGTNSQSSYGTCFGTNEK